jgi:hypothetical protein
VFGAIVAARVFRFGFGVGIRHGGVRGVSRLELWFGFGVGFRCVLRTVGYWGRVVMSMR